MKKRKLWESHLCPICEQCKETTDNVIQCKSEQSQTQYSKSIQNFFQYLEKVHTDPNIIYIFKSTLSSLTQSSFTYFIPTYEVDQDFKKAAHEQDEIRWENIFKGHLSKNGLTSKWNIFVECTDPRLLYSTGPKTLFTIIWHFI